MIDERNSNELTGNRTQLVWGTCDELAAEGTKPTMRLVRARGKMRGSDADIQADVNTWFTKTFEQITLARQADPIPDALKKAMTILWSVATAEAAATFNGQREDMEKRLAAAQESNAETESELKDALARIENAKTLLASRQSEIERLQTQVEADSGEILSLTGQLSALKSQSIEEKKRHATEREATIRACRERVQEFKAECTRRVDELTTTNQQHIATLKSQLEASETARNEDHTHSMREIDIARQATKAAQIEIASKEAAIGKIAQRSKELEGEAATLRIEVATLSSTLESERESFGKQIAHIKEELAQAQHRNNQDAQTLNALSSQFAALTAKISENFIAVENNTQQSQKS